MTTKMLLKARYDAASQQLATLTRERRVAGGWDLVDPKEVKFQNLRAEVAALEAILA